ncbi:MAG: hypothetical protein EOO13_15810 [Chitinophagaceae bacterium]|nr:MAG: hypothetical protein EOO13_15810 [Chitinophagaceae bacterium]
MTDPSSLPIPPISINEKGELLISPSATSSKHDFDFFEGKWLLHNKKLLSRLSGCTEWIEFDSTQQMRKILHGIGNIDNFITEMNGEPFEGMTLRLFNRITKLWSIYWADSNYGVLDQPVVGSFNKKIGHFFTRDKFHDKDVTVVFCWDARDHDHPVWGQAMSIDEGVSWEWNWFMYMTRQQELFQ